MRWIDVLVDPADIVEPLRRFAFDVACAPRKISYLCDKLQLTDWLGDGAEVLVEQLTTVRDWKSWFFDCKKSFLPKIELNLA